MTTIHILGSGCAKCNQLHTSVQQAVDDLGLECEIIKVTDMLQFINYGVMITPALVVDGKLKVAGKLPTNDELKKFLTE